MLNSSSACKDPNWTMVSSAGILVDLCGRPLLTTNASKYDSTDPPTRYLGQVIFPVLLALSTVGNLFCIRRFMAEKRKRSPIVYLISLCTANLFVMWFELPGYLGTYFETVREQASYIDLMDGCLGFLMWLQQTFILISNGVLIIFTLDRIITVSKPSFLHPKVRIRQAISVCGLLTVVAALISLPGPVFYQTWLNLTLAASPNGACDVTASMLCDWLEKWSRIRRSLDIFFFNLALPLLTFVVLLATSVTWMVLEGRSRRKKKSERNGALQNDEKRLDEASQRRLLDTSADGLSVPLPLNGANSDGAGQSSLSPREVPPLPLHTHHVEMLTHSVILYFATQFLDLIFALMVLLCNYPSCSVDVSRDKLALWQPIVQMITLLNYSINFCLYVGLMSNLRSVWKQHLRTPLARPNEYEMVPVTTGEKMVRFLDRRAGLDVQLPQMKREKSSVFWPHAVGTILDSEMFRELWLFLPFRTRIYHPLLIFTTSEDGTSIANFLNTVRGHDATILAVRTMKGEIFGAYCGSSWDDRVLGKREYLFFGTGETFLFVFNPKLHLYPWIGMCGRKTSPDSCLYMAADAHHLTVGGGGEEAITFESSLARGFSGSSLTFNNPPLCDNGVFESAVVEVYAFVDAM